VFHVTKTCETVKCTYVESSILWLWFPAFRSPFYFFLNRQIDPNKYKTMGVFEWPFFVTAGGKVSVVKNGASSVNIALILIIKRDFSKS